MSSKPIARTIAGAAFVATAAGAGTASADALEAVRNAAITATTGIVAGGAGVVVGSATGNPAAGVAAGAATVTAFRPMLDRSTRRVGERLGSDAYNLQQAVRGLLRGDR